MAALVTATPTAVDLTNESTGFFTNINGSGYIQNGNDLYQVLISVRTTTFIGVYKSTITANLSDLATWTEQDSGNHIALPAMNATGNSIFYDSANGKIWILYTISNQFYVQPFDVNANTWGAASAASPAFAVGQTAALYMNGSTLIAVSGIGAGVAARLAYITSDGSTWDLAFTDITAPGTAWTVYGSTVDSNNIGYIFANKVVAGGLFCVTLSALLVAGTPAQVSAVANWDAWPISVLIWNSKLYVAYNEDYGAPNDKLRISYTNLGTAPAFTAVTVDTVSDPTYFYYYPTLTTNFAGDLAILTSLNVTGAPPPSEMLLYTSSDGSTWSSSTSFYDQVTNPPAEALPFGPLTFLMGAGPSSAIELSIGWVAMAQMTVNFPTSALNVVFTLLAATPATSQPTPGPSGRRPLPLTPNDFDFCLHREFRLFQQIDYELLGCGRLPSCFKVDEREWGGWE